MHQPTFRLLIVDDEPLARMRIRSFDLAARGYEIAGEAENGEQAWRMLEKLQPDIVIADIGMPILDGLGLLKRIRGMTSPPAVILLTCFEDFEKVQSAMRNGAVDYLTKLLLSETEFISCLDRAVEEIRKARMQKHWTLRQLLQDWLLSGGTSASADALEYELSAFKQFRLALLRFPGDVKHDAARMIDAYEKEFAPYASFVIRLTGPLWAVLIASSETNGSADFNAWTMQTLKQGYDECLNRDLEPLQSLSGFKYKLAQLPDALVTCRKLLEQAFYEPKGCVIVGENGAEGETSSSSNARLKALYTDIKKTAEEDDAAALATLLISWRDEIAMYSKPGTEQLKHAGFELSSCFREDFDLETEERAVAAREWILSAIEHCEHVSSLFLIITQLIESLNRRTMPTHRCRQEIREAIKYIRSNYQEDIDLVTVARQVNLSPSWFGTLFRNETGHSFLDYLQDFRLEQAKAMMAQSDLKIYEISTLVGIANPRYFSRLFSDKYRISPQDYRSKARSKLLG
ncbi:response regulator [Paenibacillus lignilyticus]|uniref:Response regulator n=1 Tax=Paenibacillus lignilyticus TaxID=1172615 RepID=A0ABS5CHY2_9BACL|nr:response regulator [Paenibacillus lignilyticus]MBP3965488.1 response regulator [Paenibacillus lignilyticus]